MKKLTLIRHAKSDWHSAAATDFARPLNVRGRKAALLIGERLAARNGSPDAIISSPAKRAKQTVKKIAEQLDFPEAEIEYREEIYEANRDTLIQLLRNIDEGYEQVLLIGHNPGFSELGEWLTPDAPEWLPTCGLLELELAVDNWTDAEQNCAAMVFYDYPKKPEC